MLCLGRSENHHGVVETGMQFTQQWWIPGIGDSRVNETKGLNR